MGIRLDEGNLREMLHLAVRTVDPTERQRSQDAFLSYLHDTETLETWGRGLANHYGRPRDWEDFVQVVSEELVRYIRSMSPESAGKFEEIDRVAAHLYFKAKAAVASWLDSPAVTVATAMAGISRRYRQSIVARNEYIAQHGREPSDAELVEHINAHAYATRKDPKKQGALVTESDVAGTMLQPYSMDWQTPDGDFAADSFGSPTDDVGVRERGELSVTVRRLGELSDEMFPQIVSPTVREVLAVWMDFVLDNEPLTVTAVASYLQVPRQTAKERMGQVDQVLARVREAS